MGCPLPPLPPVAAYATVYGHNSLHFCVYGLTTICFLWPCKYTVVCSAMLYSLNISGELADSRAMPCFPSATHEKPTQVDSKLVSPINEAVCINSNNGISYSFSTILHVHVYLQAISETEGRQSKDAMN